MKKAYLLVITIFLILFSACSPVKYVADGDFLLDDVKLDVKNSQLKENDAKSYIRQQPNLKIFGLFRAHLRLYSLSRKDSVKRNGRVRHLGRALRKMGEPPVIYNSMMRIQSERQLEKYYRAKGFMNAKASSDVEFKKKRAVVTYHVDEGEPFRIENIDFDYRGDSAIQKIVETDRFYESKLKTGMLFDSDELDAERNNMSSLLRRHGYFYFTKDYITYTADTTVGDHKVDLTLELKPFSKTRSDGSRVDVPHTKYKIGDVSVITLDKPMTAAEQITVCIISVDGEIPADADLTVEVTNNGNDSSPVWEDATAHALSGMNHAFSNSTQSNGWAFNFRVTVHGGDTRGYITSIQGGFQ